MCNRCLSGRPYKEDLILEARNKGDMLNITVAHDKKKYSEKEWEEYCKERLQLSQQDPEGLMCYGVFI